MSRESGNCVDEGLCSICNEICSTSTPTQEETSKFYAFYQLVSGIAVYGNQRINNLCEMCKAKLAKALEAIEEVVKSREKVSNELTSLETKVNLAILHLETVSDIPTQVGAAPLLQNGVQCATFKMRALNYILKTVSTGLQVASFELNGGSSSSSPKENTLASDLQETFDETPTVPDAECSDVENCAIPVETDEHFEAEEEPEITIGKVFMVKSEPTEEDQNDPGPSSVSEDSEPIIEALIKTEAPQVARMLRRRDIYASSKNPPQIITNPPESLLPSIRSAAAIVEPEVIDLEAEPCIPNEREGGTKRKRSPEVSTEKKGKTDKTEHPSDSTLPSPNVEENTASALLEAARSGNLDKIRELTSKKDVQELIQKSTLTKADERKGPSEKISKLIISCVELSLDDHQVKIEKKKEIITCLLKVNKNLLGPLSKEDGADSEKESYRYSPLLCLDVHPDLILFLLDLGADIKSQSHVSSNIILDYLEFFTKKIDRSLLQKYLQIFERVISKMPEKGCNDSLQKDLANKLISYKEYQFLSRVCFWLDKKDPNGYTLLSHMVFYKNFEITTIKKLVGWGADLKWVGKMCGESLLHRAVQNGHVEAVEYFLEEAPQLVNARDEDGKTPLDWLIFTRSEQVPLEDCLTIAEKLHAGGNFAREGENGGNMLHAVAVDMIYDRKGLNTEILSRLGFDVKQKDNFGNTPLHVACKSLEESSLSRFSVIPLGAELVDGNGSPTEFPDYLCTIRALIRCGASTTERNGHGETPERIIDRINVSNGLKRFVKRLLNYEML